MPLSELCGMARGRLESAQQKTTTCLTDLTPVPENEFVELVWENGQIVVQGQSNRAKRTSTSNSFQSQTPELRDKDIRNATNSKMGKFAAIDSVLNDFAAAVPSAEAGLDQDDDVVPWLNYPIDNSLQHDYCSELLPELSGVSANELPVHSSFASMDKRNTSNQTIRSSHSVSVRNVLSSELANAPKVSSSEVGESARSRSGQLYPWSFQESQTSVPSLGLGVSSIISNSTSNSAGDFPSAKIQKQDSGLPNGNSGIMNFSHFSRPAALVRVNHQNNGAMATHVALAVEGMGDKNKATRTTSNIAESTLADLNSCVRKEMISHRQPSLVQPKLDSKPLVAKPLDETCTAQRSETICRDDAVKVDMLPDQAIGATASKQMPDGEKTVEPVVAASSVCSGNSVDRVSDDPTHNLKRKGRETDDSEGRSEDVEEESVGIRKAAPARGSGSKRSRAAEVHNLSERRRRDRINEKMRVLQELIPNCNKVDKASMLDEAIEYLKTLQLQVLMMSMGAGLYMPPMMFPTGMQHLHAAQMAHLSRMGVGMGMGMGMGFGMGIMDMNGGSPGCPMMQGPPMHGAHFPAPRLSPISGPTSFQGVAGPNLQVFGHPGQGFPVSVPRFPLVPLSGGPPISSYMGLNISGMTAPPEVPNSSPSSTSKDFLQNTNTKVMQNTDATSSMNQTSSQHQATNESREQSSLALKKDLPLDVGSSGNVSLTKENDTVPSRPGCPISGAKLCHRRTGI